MEYFLKIKALWHVAPYSLVGVDRRFRGAYFLHQQTDVSTYVMKNSYQMPENSSLTLSAFDSTCSCEQLSARALTNDVRSSVMLTKNVEGCY
jgi:hypothetical protein